MSLIGQQLESEMQQMSLAAAEGPAGTPESLRFRSLPQAMQRCLLNDFPLALATAMHRYSDGADCESILMELFAASSQMLRHRNSQGDNPVAAALVRRQAERAEKLMDLAASKNPAALDDRSQFRETMLMLSTSCSSAARLMERLLERDPTQLHRLYDDDGRNILHHCALEESADALESALRLTAKLMKEDKLRKLQVSAAVHMNDTWGHTPIHMMAARNRCDMLALLVQFTEEAGIDIDIDERQHCGSRWTPLMMAVAADATEAAELLLSCGADPAEEDTEGRTAIDLAAGNDRMTRLLNGVVSKDVAVLNVAESEAVKAVACKVDGGSAAWLTAAQSVTSIDSGVDSMQFNVQIGSLDPDSLISQEEQNQLETQLAISGKSLAFLAGLSRRDPRLKIESLMLLSEKPVEVAFCLWRTYNLHVPWFLAMETLKEIQELGD